MRNRFAPTLLSLSLLLGAFLSTSTVQAKIIETSRNDISIWSSAGSSNSIEKLRPYEQVQVIGSKTQNGETWYQVKVERYPGWETVERVGWVNGKYFKDSPNQTPPARRQTVASAGCISCNNRSNPSSLHRQAGEIARVTQYAATARNTTPTRATGGFIWPAQGRYSSKYGMRRHPIKRVMKKHNGIDISGNNGAKVHAAKAGVVEVASRVCQRGNAGCNGGAGNMVTINHGDGTKTRYMHLSASCPLPRRGTRVSQGDVIACVGATGRVTGPHLHFEVIKNGQHIDPISVLPTRRGS